MTDSAVAVSRTPSRASRYRLEHVPDEALHAEVKMLAGRHNVLTADLLAHLAEVEARAIHRERACSSLYTYCLYELRLSEDEAQRRARAARAAREFPALFEMLADGAIHLTGILLLAPYLTAQNHEELLARARFRTKREIERLVSEIAPRPDVPGRVEPLGPRSVTRANLWQAFTASLRGPVRELRPGSGRGDAPPAVFDDTATAVLDPAPSSATSELARTESERARAGVSNDGGNGASSAPARTRAPGDSTARAPLRYRVEFTASEEYVGLLEEARNLVQHQVPNRDIGRVHELAMAAFVEHLRKRRQAAVGRSRKDAPSAASEDVALEESAPEPASAVLDGPRPERVDAGAGRRSAPARVNAGADRRSAPARIGPGDTPHRGQKRDSGRYVPAAIRREIWRRDEGRCTFTDSGGRRCEERGGLELHHEHAFALGGPTTATNLRLVCRAHNALFAERDFGREYVDRRRRSHRAG